MKKILAGFILSLVLLTGVTIKLMLQKDESPSLNSFIQQRWPQIITRISTTDRMDLTYLLSDTRPAELTHVELLVAHYQNFNLNELQELFAFSRNCHQKINRPKTPELQKPWLWISASCFQQKLPKDFFRKPPFLFPSGQSYVQMAENQKFDFSGYLTSDEIKVFKSISELMLSSSVGSDLNLQQINGFLQGEDTLLGENFVYLKVNLPIDNNRTRIYSRVPREIWQNLVKEENFIFTDLVSERCLLSTTNGCWVTNIHAAKSNRQFYLTIVLILDGLVFLLVIIFFWIDRRRRFSQKENQRFALQMLTHELRTPVTTIALQLENIRSEFDHLTPKQQLDFLKMSQEVTRLKNSMQMSYAYLQTDAIHDNKLKIASEKLDLNAFLQTIALAHNSATSDQNVYFEASSETVFVNAEPQWLSLCINNLIRNAFDHGRPPVSLKLLIKSEQIGIQVRDAGEIHQRDLASLTIPFQKHRNSRGLGLGLSIIHQVLKEMDGRLVVERNPTRFSIFLRRIL